MNDDKFSVEDDYRGLEGFNSDRPLVMGSIEGLRSFRVNEEGKLAAVVDENFVYHEGINDAKCFFNDHYEEMNALYQMTGFPHLPLRPLHRVGAKNCSCGFYAYTDSFAVSFDLPSTVLGVVEGSGLVTVGSLGFRAERAKVVALVMPSPLRRRRFIDLYLLAAFNTLNFLFQLTHFFTSGRPNVFALTVTLLSCLFTAVLIAAAKRGSYRKDLQPIASDRLEKLKENYPSVTWYSSRRKLLKAYPSIAKGASRRGR